MPIIGNSLKECSRCHAQLPNTQEFFYRKSGRCKACLKIIVKEWAANNPEKRHDSVRKYDAAHRKESILRNQEWRKHNPEKSRARTQAWRDRNRERFNMTSRTRKKLTYAANPLPFLQANASRRALRHQCAINDLTYAQWETIKLQFQHRCAYCGKKPKHLTQDHITPLSKGGNHTMSNIIPACVSCNSKKKDKDILRPVQPLLL